MPNDFNKLVLVSMQAYMRWMSFGLVLVSSTLLGIWAVKDTIALRNILLALGCPLSFFYIFRIWHDRLSRLRLVNYLPFFMLLTMFIWVVGHYLFLSTSPHLQWQELTGTWLRSFMAVILGFGTGLAVHQMRWMLPALWVGIAISFAYLIYQYIPKAQQLHSLFAIDWSPGYYIYIGKINGVLMGSILVAALIGVWVDRFKASEYKLNLWLSSYCLLGICLTLYSYVFIFDTRNGLGLAFILTSCWMLFGIVWGFLRLVKEKSFSNIKFLVAPVLIIAIGMGWFGSQQMQRNSGWVTMFEDAAIAAQTEKYINWQDTDKFGSPKNEQGRSVALNTYQRVSWALVGMQLIPTQPFGGGVLAESFKRSLKQSFPEANPISTHSAWIEISLAFGIPGLIFTVGTIFAILLLAITSSDKSFSATIYTLCFTLLFLYSIGELSTQHGIEVLFYMMAFLSALQLPATMSSDKIISTE